MKKLFCYGASPTVVTGLGTVSKNLLSSLSSDFEITVLGINDRGGWKDPKLYPYKIYPAIYYPFDDKWGVIRLLRYFQGKDPEIKFEEPDIFFVNNDFFLFHTIHTEEVSFYDLITKVIPPKTKKVLYTPVDSDEIYLEWLPVFGFFDEVVVPSYFGRSVLKKYLKKEVKVIYYPLDTKNYFPQENNDKPKDKFIIGYVGRNQYRKDLFRLIYIFSLFKQNHKDAFLYIHTQPKDRNNQGWDLFALANHLNLKEGRDFYFPDVDDNKGVSVDMMRKTYNYFDVFLSCSTCEGFGLPYAEASLCEVPVLIPDNTTAYDFKQYLTVYKSGPVHSFGFIDGNRIRRLADIDDALLKLEDVYNNKEKYKQKAKKAREFFLQFSSSNIGKKFSTLLTK